jgi:hypothetical protein
METVKFASYINSEVFSFNVGWIPESQFLTIVCYYPINPKNPLSRRVPIFNAENSGAAYYRQMFREASVNCPIFLTQI